MRRRRPNRLVPVAKKTSSRGVVKWVNDEAPVPVETIARKRRGKASWTNNDGVKAVAKRSKVTWVQNDGFKPAPFLKDPPPAHEALPVVHERLIPFLVPGTMWLSAFYSYFHRRLSEVTGEPRTMLTLTNFQNMFEYMREKSEKSAATWRSGPPLFYEFLPATPFVYIGDQHFTERCGKRDIQVPRPVFVHGLNKYIIKNINDFVPLELAEDETGFKQQFASRDQIVNIAVKRPIGVMK